MGEFIAWLILGIVVVICIRDVTKNIKSGSCGSCSSCSGGCASCGGTCSHRTDPDKVRENIRRAPAAKNSARTRL